MACFPATKSAFFEGEHAFFALEEPLPPQSELTIEVVPGDPALDVNLYGFITGTTSFHVPPYVPGVTACEASYPIGLTGVGNPGASEFVLFQNPSTKSWYNVFFAVATPGNVAGAGPFTIVADITTADPWCPESLPGESYAAWPDTVTVLTPDASGVATASGTLADGACVNTDFAADSAVACFPGTRAHHFHGHHVFYALSTPIAGGHIVTVTATPTSASKDISLYGYLTGSYLVPPQVPSVLQCEASYPASVGGAGNPGAAETISFAPGGSGSYKLFFAVTGTDSDGTTGGFDIEVQIL